MTLGAVSTGSIVYSVYSGYKNDLRVVSNDRASPGERVDAANRLQETAQNDRQDKSRNIALRAIMGMLGACGYHREVGAMNYGDQGDPQLRQDRQQVEMENMRNVERDDPPRPSTDPRGSSGGSSNTNTGNRPSSAGEGSSQPRPVCSEGYRYIGQGQDGKYWEKSKTGSKLKWSRGPGKQWHSHDGPPPKNLTR